jgi:hypothetical protein
MHVHALPAVNIEDWELDGICFPALSSNSVCIKYFVSYVQTFSCGHTFLALPAVNIEDWELDGICFPALLRQVPKMLGLFFVVTFGSCLDVAAIQADMPFPIDFNSELGTGAVAAAAAAAHEPDLVMMLLNAAAAATVTLVAWLHGLSWGLFFVVTFGSCLDAAAILGRHPFPTDFNSVLGTGAAAAAAATTALYVRVRLYRLSQFQTFVTLSCAAVFFGTHVVVTGTDWRLLLCFLLLLLLLHHLSLQAVCPTSLLVCQAQATRVPTFSACNLTILTLLLLHQFSLQSVCPTSLLVCQATRVPTSSLTVVTPGSRHFLFSM